MMTLERHPHFPRSRPQAGFSLVELMIASLIGLIITTALVRIMMDTSSSHREIARAGQLLEDGRYAMQLLQHELEHAGFFDQFDTPELAEEIPDPCSTDLDDLKNDMSFAVQGFDAQSSDFSRPSCIPQAAYKPSTDIVVIRRAETTAAATAKTDTYYLQSRFDSYVLDLGQNTGSFSLTNPMNNTVLPLRRYRVDLYFISPCSDFSGGVCQDEIPTLKRMELGAGPEFRLVTLVEGIENLQLFYGVDREPIGAPDGAPDQDPNGKLYIANPGDPATAAGREAWANVVAVQLYLLARDVNPAPGHKDQKSYVLGPSELSPADRSAHTVAGNDKPYKRQVFSSQIRITNISSRREN